MTAEPTLLEAFDGLVAPPADGAQRRFTTHTVEPGLRVAKSSDHRAAFIVSTTTADRAPLVTRHLRADFSARLQVVEDGIESTEVATIIECLVSERSVTEYFIVAVGAVVDSLASPGGISTALDYLVHLFRAMSQPPERTVQGLWGELFVIDRASDPALLIDHWHVSPRDRYDFASPIQRVEVKTTAGTGRRHRFSHEQLADADQTPLVVASVIAASSAGGATIRDLVESISTRIGLDTRLRMRLLGAVADTLGDAWSEASAQRFDDRQASTTLRFFDGRSIPRVTEPIALSITDVRYSVLLDERDALRAAAVALTGDLGKAIVTRTES